MVTKAKDVILVIVSCHVSLDTWNSLYWWYFVDDYFGWWVKAPHPGVSCLMLSKYWDDSFYWSVLNFLLFCRNLQKLSLYGDTCVLQQEGLLEGSNLHQIHQGDKKINE